MAISRCLVLSEDGFHKYQGYYVNGGIRFCVQSSNGHLKEHRTKYNSERHTLIVDDKFDDKMALWRDFLAILKRRKISKFAKSVVWKECLELKILFKNYMLYNAHIKQMINLNVLTIDGKYLKPGEQP